VRTERERFEGCLSGVQLEERWLTLVVDPVSEPTRETPKRKRSEGTPTPTGSPPR
jgi:hypothetical protein